MKANLVIATLLIVTIMLIVFGTWGLVVLARYKILQYAIWRQKNGLKVNAEVMASLV